MSDVKTPWGEAESRMDQSQQSVWNAKAAFVSWLSERLSPSGSTSIEEMNTSDQVLLLGAVSEAVHFGHSQRDAGVSAERAGLIKLIPPDLVIRSREGGGPESQEGTLALSVNRMASEVAELRQAKEELVGLLRASIRNKKHSDSCICIQCEDIREELAKHSEEQT